MAANSNIEAHIPQEPRNSMAIQAPSEDVEHFFADVVFFKSVIVTVPTTVNTVTTFIKTLGKTEI
jgi:hypothetical protein